MYKLTGFLRFLPGVDKDEARRYWREEHGRMLGRIPGLQRCVQNYIVEAMPIGEERAGPLPVDGYIAHWYADRAALETAMNSPEWAAVVADSESFIDVSTALMGPVEERVLKDGKAGAYKTFGVAYFPSGMDKKDASTYWTETHGPLTLKAPGFSRYVQNHSIADPDWNLELDGYAEHWFPERETYLRSIATPEWRLLEEDGPNFIDMTRLWGGAVEEVVVKG
jgi:uncharacterized protein (TIGR02118 family)